MPLVEGKYWSADDQITVYALENADERRAYVGLTKHDAETRALNFDHKPRRGWMVKTLEVVAVSESTQREHYWHEVYRAEGWELESQSWVDIGSKNGKAAGRQNLRNWWNSLSDAEKQDIGMIRTRAAAEAGAYLIASEAAKRVRVTCSCGRESNAPGIARHQKSSGHEGKTVRHDG